MCAIFKILTWLEIRTRHPRNRENYDKGSSLDYLIRFNNAWMLRVNIHKKGEKSMKKRRIVVVSFILVAALVMGIAYASLADNLFIKGEANVSTTVAQQEFDADVRFITEGTGKVEGTGGTAAVPTDKEETVKIGSTDPDSATFYVYTLGKQNESVTFSVAIKNDSTEFDAVVTLDTGYPTTTNNKFKIEYSTDKTFPTEPVTEITCKAGGTATVYVRVTLVESPEENTTSAFNVNLTATSKPKETNG